MPHSVRASFLPSGENAGAPLMPARWRYLRSLARAQRCTYTPDCLPSNDT